MIALVQPNGKIAIPDTEYDKMQRKALKSIKDDGMTIVDLDKFTVYNPENAFMNRYRDNADGSRDILMGAAVINEINTGALPKVSYRVLRIKQKTGLLNSLSNSDYETVVVSSTDIISGFVHSMPINELEAILEASNKKGVKYFG